MTTAGNTVDLRDVRKSYGPVEVLHGVDLSLHAGRARALVGENGAGKSTLLGVIAGKTQDWTGEFTMDGKPVRFGSVRAAQRGGVALIHQETMSLPTLTVAENVMAGRLPTRSGLLRRRSLHDAAAEALAALGVELDLEAPASELGTAELQLVDISRALLSDPAVLLLDEPTASLPAEGRDRLFTVVRSLLHQQKSVVFISHHLDEVFELCDDVTVLRDGYVVADLATRDSSASAVAELMIGRELAVVDAVEPRALRSSEPAFVAESLSDGAVLHEVDVDVRPGEIVGVTGLLGAGQRELVEAIVGARPSQGSMYLDGRPWSPGSIRESVETGIGILTEDRKVDGLILDESITVNVGLASTVRKPWGRYRAGQERRAARTLIDELSVRPTDEDIAVEALSGGNQQKVALAKWLREPRSLMLLHEPTRGVDVGAKALLHERIRTLAEAGTAVLLVSSDLPEVVALCERAFVLRRGRVSAALHGREITQHNLLLAASQPLDDLETASTTTSTTGDTA